MVWKYDPKEDDSDAKPIETLRYRRDEKLMNGPGGWAREVITRDPANGEAKTERFAADGLVAPAQRTGAGTVKN